MFADIRQLHEVMTSLRYCMDPNVIVNNVYGKPCQVADGETYEPLPSQGFLEGYIVVSINGHVLWTVVVWQTRPPSFQDGCKSS